MAQPLSLYNVTTAKQAQALIGDGHPVDEHGDLENSLHLPTDLVYPAPFDRMILARRAQ